MQTKTALRTALRKARREHAAAQPDRIRALLFHRPPRPLLQHIAPNSIIGLYRAMRSEAPTAGYARFFAEEGHQIALPWFRDDDAAMEFRAHTDPFSESDLEDGPFDIRQPSRDAPLMVPDVLIVPLVGFTSACERLGQGGGHYDRWLADHHGTTAIGLAWDVQLIEPSSVYPNEPHDVPLNMIVTPTRIYERN